MKGTFILPERYNSRTAISNVKKQRSSACQSYVKTKRAVDGQTERKV